MPRLLLFEECLAAGTQGPLGAAAESFLPEGLAMTLAIAEDFAKLNDWKVQVIRATEHESLTSDEVRWRWVDARVKVDEILFREARISDATIVIAPECGGLLHQRAQTVLDAGGKLLGPTPDWISMTSDKSNVLHLLAKAGLRTPSGVSGAWWQFEHCDWRFPMIMKPNDGAGATDTLLIQSREELVARFSPGTSDEPLNYDYSWRGEEFITGRAASVALLCGPAGPTALRPAMQQIVFEDGRVSYHGGALNLSSAEEARAQKLGLAVERALPPTNGYIGVDLILGEATDGSQDTVIEVNPRLTTSYLGLRAATEDSLAIAMWRIARGETVNINWLPNVVEFTKQGQVTIRDR